MFGIVRLDRAAPAGADRIDQHQVGEGEPGVGIVAQGRGRRIVAVRPEIEDARADQAEMQESGRRARPAVENEGQRPVCARAFGDIGGIEHRRALVAGLVVERQRSGGRRIGEPSFGRIDQMVGDGVARKQAQHAFAGLVLLNAVRLSLRVCLVRFLGGSGAKRAGEEHRQRETQERSCLHGTPHSSDRFVPPGSSSDKGQRRRKFGRRCCGPGVGASPLWRKLMRPRCKS